MSLGSRIRKARLDKGLTQDDIAQKLGMGRSNVGHIENGRTMPTAEVLDKLAEILSVSTDYLLGRYEPLQVGDRIRALRNIKGIRQARLARDLGLRLADVEDWERGARMPNDNILLAIAGYFGVAMETLKGIPHELSSELYADGYTDESYQEDMDSLFRRHLGPSQYDSNPGLSQKDERDIAINLERLLNELQHNESLAFYGEEFDLDEESRELLKMSLEQSMRLAKQMAKQKFNPKKNKK